MAKKKLPSVLAFEKKLVPSSGYMYGALWEERKKDRKPLKLITKSVRGTISNRQKSNIKNDPEKLNAEVEKANLQTVDTCVLGSDQNTLILNFTLKVLSGVEHPSVCNDEDFSRSCTGAVRGYIEKEGFKELGFRYAMNLANARFLWRNRVGAESIEIIIKTNILEEKEWIFDSLELPFQDFETRDDKVEDLGSYIAEALSGKRDHLLLDVTAYAKIGRAQEVYPSEELVFEKGRGDKSKILFEVDGIAGMHSQKIGNAIRTIDTWYPEYNESITGPIAIEPYGAVTTLGKAYRTPTKKVDFYTYFDQFGMGAKLSSIEAEHYVIAILVRGGVFGESSKE